MRLIAPVIIALFGAGIGLAVNYFFSHRGLRPVVAAVVGAVSGFAGLILRDILDLSFVSDQLFDAFLSSLATALVVSIIAHVVGLLVASGNKPDTD